MMRLVASPSRLVMLWLTGLMLLVAGMLNSLPAQETQPSAEEQREQVAAERFLQLLLQRPATGTALERVFGFHVARGDLGELLEKLAKQAAEADQAGDARKAGNHWMVIGLLQLQRGEEAAAAEALAKAEPLLKDNPLAAYHQGRSLLLLGKEQAAAEAMQRAIDRKPAKQDFLEIATELGRLYQRAGQTTEALGIWKQLEASFPGDDSVRQRIARTLADEGDLKNALERFDALAKDAKQTNDRIVYALRAADLRLQLGQKEQARKDLEALLARLRPESYLYAEARRRIENAFLESADYAGLTEYYQTWIKAHPDDVGAVLRLARTLSAQGRGAEALQWLEKAIERSPTDIAPRLALIDTYIAEQRYADASAQYAKLAEMEPKNPDHLVRWGQTVLEDVKQPKEERRQAAAAIWKKLADARPEDAVVQSQVADLLRGAELTEAAIAGYRQAIQLAPSEPQYKEYLGEYLHRLDRHAEALPVWRSIAEGQLRTRENLVRLAEVLHQFEEPAEALKTLAEACGLNPTITERLRYAEWLRDAGENEKALQQLQLANAQTDTVDDRDKVFTAEVRLYQHAGQLEQRIAEAKQKAEDAKTDGELWLRLAVLYDANRQTRESLLAIEEAVKHASDSIGVLDVASRMYEAAGRVQEAIEKRKLLADTDRRFRSGHLQRLASLYMRLGQTEEALATGKLLLAGGGGSLESFKFYADLCGQAGKLEERLDTYQRCLRINPRSLEAQQLLAAQLASDFKTDQAIELYWKMLDSATELDERRDVVKSLTELYLRSNRLDQLISRLEIRGRESGDHRATVDLVATAYEQAGDLGLARESLESLLREQGRDTLLLDRLVTLAEKAGEAEEAVQLQRQLLRLTPNRQAEARLATLLVDIGATEEAEDLWLRLSEQAPDRQQITRNINRLFTAGELELAIRIIQSMLAQQEADWESWMQLMILQAAGGKWEEAIQSATKLRSLKIPETTLPAGGKPYQTTRTVSGQTVQLPPLRYMRTQQMYELYYLLDDRYGYNPSRGLPTPLDYGHARLMALWIILKEAHSRGKLKELIEPLAKQAQGGGATRNDVWEWYVTINLTGEMEPTLSMNYQKPENWTPAWKLVEVDPEMGSLALTTLLYNRWSISLNNPEIKLNPLPEANLQWLKEKAAEKLPPTPSLYYSREISWPLLYDQEMQIAGQTENAAERSQEYLARALEQIDLQSIPSLMQLVSNRGDDDQFWTLVEFVLKNSQAPTLQISYGTRLPAACLTAFAQQQRIDKKLSQGPADVTYRKRVLALVNAMILEDSAQPVRRRTLQMSTLGQARSTYMRVGSSYRSVQITFPPYGVGPDDQFIQSLWAANEMLKAHNPRWIEQLPVPAPEADPRLRVLREIVVASVLHWNEQTGQSIRHLADTVPLAAREAPHEEPALRLMWVDLLLQQGRKQEALQVIEGMTVYDQNTMTVREFAAMRLAAALGDQERARTAARRLFGVRLDVNAQLELARLMRSLDMHELASDLVRRMRSRGGNNTTQLYSLMTYFVSQGDKDQAAQVAIELLRRSVPTRQQSTNVTTVIQSQRRTALQTLASVGRLTSLIEATEDRLQNSPKSQRIRGELAEMYTSAGQTEKAQKLLAESSNSDTQSLAALEQVAWQLTNGGKASEACDAWLKLLPRKPDLFRNQYDEIMRPFQQAKRLDELADVILEIGVSRFEIYVIGQLCQNYLYYGEKSKDDKNGARFRKLYLAMLELPPTTSNAQFALNSVVTSYSKITEDAELLEKTLNFLIQGSLQAQGNWNMVFSGYSTGSDGRHYNAAMNLTTQMATDDKSAQVLEDLLRKTLRDHPNWQEGCAWLGTLLAARKQYPEATALLEPLLDKQTRPAPTYYVFWLIGSVIDKHQPMQELALKMYRHSMIPYSAEMAGRGSDFQSSLPYRACQLLIEMGRKAEGRELLLEAVEAWKKAPSPYRGNVEYEAYRAIQQNISFTTSLQNIGYPTDALRLTRQMDMSLFDKAGRFDRGMRDRFIQQRDELIKEVRKLGGLAVVESMLDAKTAGPFAVDLGVTVGERPFTENGLQSLWIEMLEQAAGEPGQAEKLKPLVEQLRALREQRPEDDSVALAHAIAASVTNDSQPLQELVRQWSEPVDPKQLDNPAFRQQALILGLIHLGRSESENDRQLLEELVTGKQGDWTWAQRLLLFAELGRQAVQRKELDTAQRYWGTLLENPQSQMLLLDLACAASTAKLNDFSCQVAAAAAGAPEKNLTPGNLQTEAGSLSSLLSTGNPNATLTSRNTLDQPDQAELRLVTRLLELDTAWRESAADNSQVCAALQKFVFGTALKPLCSAVQIQTDHQLVVDSVYDRLARRAKAAQLTDQLLARLNQNEPGHRLLSGLALLRTGQSEEAARQYAQVDASGLKTLPKEVVIQALLPALDDPSSLPEALRLGLALVEANKPTEQYQDIAPFDSLAFKLGRDALRAGNSEVGLKAANLYLDLSEHYNARILGAPALSRRLTQLNDVSALLMSHGQLEASLRYTALRQSLFELGEDRGLDWVAWKTLQLIEDMQPPERAYQLLADWSLAGDGALRVLYALKHRQRLPAWIPESVSGPYPATPTPSSEIFPILTNWYTLARLAEKSGRKDDLLNRLKQAHQQQRGGAAEALALTYAALNQPVPRELLDEIMKRMESIDPDTSPAKTALPLPAMQLATLLAEHPEHSEWAKTFATRFEEHGHKSGRSYPMPWLFRFQYEHGWSEAARLKRADGLTHWLPSSSASAGELANGRTPPIWLTDGESQLHHLGGLVDDRNWFRYPLQGDFEFHAELKDGNWQEWSLQANGLSFQGNGTSRSVDVRSTSSRDWVRYTTATLKNQEWNRYTLRFQGNTFTCLVNDVPIYQERREQTVPWIALYGNGLRYGASRHVRITGTPVIPAEVDLLPENTLRGWACHYYNQPLPTARLNQDVHEPSQTPNSAQQYTTAPPTVSELTRLAWTVQNGELISGRSLSGPDSLSARQSTGPATQSLIQYERPLGEGETLSYEFFYEPGQALVHPAIARTAYLLDPEGVQLHWMTEPSSTWKTPNDFAVPASKDNPVKLSLQAGDWNQVTLQVKNNQLQIHLNGTLILDQPIELSEQGHLFGLFHYADQTKARVRNLKLTGPWPQTLPENLFQMKGD